MVRTIHAHTKKKKKTKQKELPDNFIVIRHLYTILIQYLFKKKKSKKQANSKAYFEFKNTKITFIGSKLNRNINKLQSSHQREFLI